MLNNKVIFITGGTGSWGHELVKQICEKFPDFKELRIYSRGEHKQVEMRREYPNDKIRFIIGDVRDKNILDLAMKNVDIVFHLAALKHVPVCEDNSWEAVLTNINGTQNVIECAIKNNVKYVVDVSTDKAVDPFNLYGVTKACGEKLMINSNFNYIHTMHATKFLCIRGGNVMGTNGSVIPLFKKQILEKNEITVTNPDMTRFLMSTSEAINLIFKTIEHAEGGELFVMRMSAAKLSVIANTMVKLFGNSNTKITYVGSRPGEKLHEVLVSKNEIQNTKIFSDKYFLILPQIVSEKLEKKYLPYEKLNLLEFSSFNTYQLSEDELEGILKKESWLWK